MPICLQQWRIAERYNHELAKELTSEEIDEVEKLIFTSALTYYQMDQDA